MNLDMLCDMKPRIPWIVRTQVAPVVSTSDCTIPLVFAESYIFPDRCNPIVEYECHANLRPIDYASEEVICDYSVRLAWIGIFVLQQMADPLHSLSSSELQLPAPPLGQYVIPRHWDVVNVVDSSFAFQQNRLLYDLNFLDL
jgi:hypothetical protein